jgi:hypothetical protein
MVAVISMKSAETRAKLSSAFSSKRDEKFRGVGTNEQLTPIIGHDIGKIFGA